MKKLLTKKYLKIVIPVGFIIVVLLLFINFKDLLVAKGEQSKIEAISKELSKEPANKVHPPEYFDEDTIYDIMHKMANSKIVAGDDQIWGTLPMDKKKIEVLKQAVEKIGYSDRAYLLEILNRWEKGDFSRCVEEHNYLWNKLDGTIGQAVRLKEE